MISAPDVRSAALALTRELELRAILEEVQI
jgi:hypothetical protein